jgi:hypothetical protein
MGKMMSRISSFMIASALATLSLMPNCRADNSPVVRDCSLGNTPLASSDADFVVLSGATLKLRKGVLSVLTSQNELDLTASESVDTGDNAVSSSHVVQLFATVSAPGQPTLSFFGTGESFVILGIPLNGSSTGQVYTISWHATFDSSSSRACPSATPPATPSNMSPNPFVVTVVPK